MKNKNKILTFLLVMIMILSSIGSSFALTIRTDPEQKTNFAKRGTYIPSEDAYYTDKTGYIPIELSTDFGEDGKMHWWFIEEDGKKIESSKKDKEITYLAGHNDTDHTVSTKVYAEYKTVQNEVYNTVSNHVYRASTELKFKSDHKTIVEIIDTTPKDGEVGFGINNTIEVTFNHPVHITDTKNKISILYGKDLNESFDFFPSFEALEHHKIIQDPKDPTKAKIELYDEDDHPIALKENYEYLLDIFDRSVQIDHPNPHRREDYNPTTSIEFDTKVLPHEIHIQKPKETIYVGERVQTAVDKVHYGGKDTSYSNILWKSSNPNVAIVDPNGILMARTAGEVTIYASVEGNGKIKDEMTLHIQKNDAYAKRIQDAIDGAAKVGLNTHYSMDWIVVGLSRSGKKHMIPKEYLENVAKELENPDENLKNKPTEYERRVLGILAAGGDPTSIIGYNPIDKICNADLEEDGINSVIFALIALDSGKFKAPKDALWTREKMIQYLLDNQTHYDKEDERVCGGWALKSNAIEVENSDPDITGMAMTALAPYHNQKEVKEAIDGAVEFLSYAQKENGGYHSWQSSNSEACSQVIMGLCNNGIDPLDKRFVKNGNNLLDGLLSFEIPDHGGFAHVINNDKLKVDGMATEQALYALAQYQYYVEGKGSIYRWEKNDLAPVLKVKGISEEIIGQEDDIKFTVEITNGYGKQVDIAVTCNDEVVQKDESGYYVAPIKEGKNHIQVMAKDTKDNVCKEEYTVIKYPKVYTVNEEILLHKNVPNKIEYENITMILDVDESCLSEGSKIHIEDVTHDEKYTETKGTKLKRLSCLLNIKGEKLSIDEKNFTTIVLQMKGLSNPKSGVYYFDEENKKWQYIKSNRKDESCTFSIKNLGVYGIFEDNQEPTNVNVQSKMVSCNEVSLQLQAQDDSKIQTYEIYRKDRKEKLGQTDQNEYLDVHVMPNTQYEYKVRAIDVYGNVSSLSVPLLITTPSKSSSNNPQQGEPDKKDHSKKVYMRVEGYENTIIPRQKISVDLFDLTHYLHKGTGKTSKGTGKWDEEQFKDPTVAHAVVRFLENHGIRYELQDYGWSLYMAMINGEREKDHKGLSGWMYRVNENMPNVGCNAKTIRDGDEIVWYYGAYGFDNVFTKLSINHTQVDIDEEIKIHLDGYAHGFANHYEDVKDATILVNGEPIEIDGKVVRTDDEGNATIKLSSNGTYSIAATRKSKKDSHHYIDIVRPVPVMVKVGTGKNDPKEKMDETYEKEYQIITGNKVEEKEVVEAIEKVTEKFKNKVEKLDLAKDIEEWVHHMQNVSKLLSKACDKVKSQENIEKIMIQASKMCDTIMRVGENVANEKQKSLDYKDVDQAITKTVQALDKGIKKMTDMKKIAQNTAKVIDMVGKISKYLGKDHSKTIIKNTQNLIEYVLNKSSVKVFEEKEMTQEENVVNIKIIQEDMTKLAEQTEYTIDTIHKKLKEYPVIRKDDLHKEITWKVPKKDVSKVEMDIPLKDIDVLSKNHIKEAKLSTELATFYIHENIFDKKYETVILGAERIPYSVWTDVMKKQIPKGSIVVDLKANHKNEKIKKFNHPIKMRIPYLGKVKEDEFVEVFHIKDNGRIESLGGIYDEKDQAVTFETMHFSKYFAKKVHKRTIQKEIHFKDLDQCKWAKEAIEYMAQEGIIQGRDEEHFDPYENLTRAEFAVLISNIFNLHSNHQSSFTDVEVGRWYYECVMAVYEKGYMKGRTDGRFDPYGKITREEMAVVIGKILKDRNIIHEYPQTITFKDAQNVSSWAKEGIKLCVQNHIIKGMENGKFCPKQHANRAQAAVLLNQLYDIL